jgi:type I restriction enzyme, S subunit
LSELEVLPLSWQWARLDQLGDVNPPRSKPNATDTDLMTFVPMAAVSEDFGGIDTSHSRPMADVQSGYTQFMSGDILLAKFTPCMENGKLAIVPPIASSHGYGSTEFHVIRPYEPATTRWIAYYLSQENIRRDARAHMTGTAGQLRVPGRWLTELRVPVAPVPDQIRIVAKIDELLTRLDASVAALKRAQANLKRYRPSVLKAAVEGKLTEAWRAEHPATETGAELLQRILNERRAAWEKAELERFAKAGKALPKGWQDKYREPVALDTADLPELPEGWAWASVEQLVLRSEYGTSVKCAYDAAGEPVLRIPNILAGEINVEDLKYSTVPLRLAPNDALTEGDILMCRTNGSISLIGKSAVVRAELTRPHTFASYLLRFRLLDCTQLPIWLNTYISSPHGRAFIERHAASSAGQHNISLSLIHRMPLPVPSVDEQAELRRMIERYQSIGLASETLVGHLLCS